LEKIPKNSENSNYNLNTHINKNQIILPTVSIIMGSDSDLDIMKEAAEILSNFNVPFEIKIVSAHRTPNGMFDFAQNADLRGIKVIIAGAGGSAHLPGMVASLTSLPVIGVPIRSSSSLIGIDSLLSIVQMPPGIPVATMAINGAKNAGIFACTILATHSKNLSIKLKKYKKQIEKEVNSKNKDLNNLGFENYQKNKEESKKKK
jgi:5-(carboxyamino)imidazole ribonucleotide mutase